MRGVLPGKRDDATCPLDTEPGEVLVGELFWRNSAVGIDDHAISQNAGPFDDRLAGHLAGNSFNVGAI